jgi:Fur family iron response transcriptional regulator
MRALAHLLLDNGVSPTAQRLLIASVLFARRQHLSADQVLGRVNVDAHHVSKATVYNTLGLFARKGLVREVIVDPARVFYDSNVSPHYHIFDMDAGTLTDVDESAVVVDRLPDLPGDVELESVDLIMRVRKRA